MTTSEPPDPAPQTPPTTADPTPQGGSDGPPDRVPGPRRGGFDRVALVLAWLGILIAAGLWMLKPELLADEANAGEADDVPPGLLVNAQDELAGRLTLGLDRLVPEGSAIDQAAALATGSTAQRVSHAILVSAMQGAQAGLDELDEIEADPVADLLVPSATEAIRASGGGPPASTAALDRLESRLGWFGRLAAALPSSAEVVRIADDASSAMLWLGGLVGVFILAGVVGLGGFVTLVVLFATGRSPLRIPAPERHGIYAETFALWMIGLLVLQVVAGLLANEDTGLLASVIAFFASLGVLGWPVIRGRSWTQVRADLGLAAPRLADVPAGVATWMMALPFLGIGILLTLLLTLLVQMVAGEAPQPSHPAQQAAVGAGTWRVVQLFLLASVAAPIVEEIMFRGVLVTHLRGLTRRWNQWLSFGLAVAISSVLFAAIHPQGLVFIPPLAGLAVGFCVGRAWQGGLVPSIIAHGVSNALVMGLNVILFAS